jgi:hypothetical protein
MSQIPTREAPLDLVQSGRDELIAGSVPILIVPQTDPAQELLVPGEPKACHRRDQEHRELETQSSILRRQDLERLAKEKPR